jgi:hypothetical protein
MVEGTGMRPPIFFAIAPIGVHQRFASHWIFIGHSVKHFTCVSLFFGGSLSIGDDASAQSAERQHATASTELCMMII